MFMYSIFLDILFGNFCIWTIRSNVGNKFIKHCVDFLENNTLERRFVNRLDGYIILFLHAFPESDGPRKEHHGGSGRQQRRGKQPMRKKKNDMQIKAARKKTMRRQRNEVQKEETPDM